jgi:hypothetical protein
MHLMRDGEAKKAKKMERMNIREAPPSLIRCIGQVGG